MKNLVTLDDFNRQRREEITKANTYPKPNGIACPECGAEMGDLDSALLLTYPSKRNIGCSKCKFVGYRIA